MHNFAFWENVMISIHNLDESESGKMVLENDEDEGNDNDKDI